MSKTPYEAPAITPIGSLHSMTLQNKFFGSADGIVLSIPGANIDIGNVDNVS